jgi:uncharacterized protein (UPF0147 family)
MSRQRVIVVSKVQAKAIPAQVPRNVRKSAHEGRKIISRKHRPPFWYTFLFEVESAPGP